MNLIWQLNLQCSQNSKSNGMINKRLVTSTWTRKNLADYVNSLPDNLQGHNCTMVNYFFQYKIHLMFYRIRSTKHISLTKLLIMNDLIDQTGNVTSMATIHKNRNFSYCSQILSKYIIIVSSGLPKALIQ